MKKQIFLYLAILVIMGTIIFFTGCGQSEVDSTPQTTVTVTVTSPAGTTPVVTEETPITSVRKIVFESGDNINVVNTDGTNEKRLDSGHAPTWSPDGQYIAYCKSDGIYIINADGTSKVKVATLNHEDWIETFVIWSPDGEKLLYMLDESNLSDNSKPYIQVQSLWIVNIDGTNNIKIVEGDFEQMPYIPTFSSDSKRLLFLIRPMQIFDPQEGWPDDWFTICIINTDGSDKIELLSLDNAFFTNCSWSPDGNNIAYKELGKLFVVDTNITSEKIYISGVYQLTSISWSPDGQKIAYKAGDHNSLWTSNYDGTGKTELVNFMVGSFSWSPDGQQLVFDDYDKIYIVNADGTGLIELIYGQKPKISP